MSQTKSFIAVVSVKTVAAGYNVGRVTSNVKWRKCNVVISFQSEAIKFAKLAHFEFVARYKTGGFSIGFRPTKYVSGETQIGSLKLFII